MTSTTLGTALDRRDNNVGALRLLLAVGVLFAHSWNLLLGPNTDPLEVATGRRLSLGGECVNLFFVLSGLLITASWMRSRGTVDYAVRRFLRVYPAFGVVVIAMVLVGPLVAVKPESWFADVSLALVAKAVVLLLPPTLPGVLAEAPIPGQLNGSLWTIRYELMCYVGLAFAGLCGLLRPRLVAVAFVVGLVLFVPQTGALEGLPDAVAAIPGVPAPGSSWPRFGTHFLAGSLMYLWRYRIPMNGVLSALAAVGFVVGIWLDLASLVSPTLGAYLLVVAALSPVRGVSSVGRRVDLSYGIYLYAFPVQQLCVHYLGEHLVPLSLFGLALALSAACALASWVLVERPCLEAKGRVVLLLRRRRPPEPALDGVAP